MCCSVLLYDAFFVSRQTPLLEYELQSVMCANVLQYVDKVLSYNMCCSVLLCDEVLARRQTLSPLLQNVTQCVAVCCSVLQCVAACRQSALIEYVLQRLAL